MRKLIAVMFVSSFAILAFGMSTGSASPKSCGSVKPKSPPFNNPVKSINVTLVAGTITCAKADLVLRDYYVGPGTEGGGPPNMIRTVYKNGFVCLQAGSGVTDAPITCTMGKNKIKATVVT